MAVGICHHKAAGKAAKRGVAGAADGHRDGVAASAQHAGARDGDGMIKIGKDRAVGTADGGQNDRRVARRGFDPRGNRVQRPALQRHALADRAISRARAVGTIRRTAARLSGANTAQAYRLNRSGDTKRRTAVCPALALVLSRAAGRNGPGIDLGDAAAGRFAGTAAAVGGRGANFTRVIDAPLDAGVGRRALAVELADGLTIVTADAEIAFKAAVGHHADLRVRGGVNVRGATGVFGWASSGPRPAQAGGKLAPRNAGGTGAVRGRRAALALVSSAPANLETAIRVAGARDPGDVAALAGFARPRLPQSRGNDRTIGNRRRTPDGKPCKVRSAPDLAVLAGAALGRAKVNGSLLLGRVLLAANLRLTAEGGAVALRVVEEMNRLVAPDRAGGGNRGLADRGAAFGGGGAAGVFADHVVRQGIGGHHGLGLGLAGVEGFGKGAGGILGVNELLAADGRVAAEFGKRFQARGLAVA